jgi:hypothetical protein
MAEAQPLDRRTVACQHCYAVIAKVPQSDWWRAVDKTQSVVCEPSALYLKHKPMPII